MRPSETPDLPDGTSVGQYTVKRRIGAGGMGEVYEAIHTGLGKRVAIKTLRRIHAQQETVVTRFLREGQLASRIRHPHVVDVTDVGMIDGLPCLVMEYLEGESLHALLKREGALELVRLIDLMLPVLAAVDAAHQQGVVHRDLKPANIFLARGHDGRPHPKVLDFGISKAVQETVPSELTTDSTFLGSPHYVSPELARGDKHLDGRSDQYSLGVILYEGACGVRPFAHAADTFMSLMYAIAQGDFPPPRQHRPGLPEQFERVVLQAMARLPSDRFGSVAELGLALLPFAGSRARVVWEPTFSDIPLPSRTVACAPPAKEISLPAATPGPSVPEETQGTIGLGALETSTTSTPRPLGWIWWTGAAAAALLLGVGVAFGAAKAVAALRNVDAPVTESGVEPSGQLQETYQVHLEVLPESATLELDDKVVGTGKLSRTFVSDGQRHKLRITAPGYEPRTVEFSKSSPPPDKLELALDADAKHPGSASATRAAARTTKAAPPGSASPPSTPASAKPVPTMKTDKDDPWGGG